MASPTRGGQRANAMKFMGMSRVPQRDLGGLETNHVIDKEFYTRCPPDVQPNTRILGLCGAHDYQGNASPLDDGWFFSDFYLFQHLLENTVDGPGSPKQTWMTCVNPIDMVQSHSKPNKPAEWYHGAPGPSRKVVLDFKIAQKVIAQGNMVVTKPEDLLDRFLDILAEEIKTAAQLNQHLLVLIFGHGRPSTYGIYVGRHKGSSMDPDKIPRLNIQTVHSITKPNVEVTFLITSCFSGGWLVQPKFENSSSIFDRSKKLPLNITGLTGGGTEDESWSMSQSRSGRASGSMLTAAVLKALLTVSETTESREDQSYSFLQARTETGELITEIPTYAALAEQVLEEYKSVKNSVDHEIRFAAKDDEWEQEWRERSGFPLLAYRKRYEALRTAPDSNEDFAHDPANDSNRAGSYPTGEITTHSDNEWENQSANLSLHGHTVRAKVKIVQAKAAMYLNSYPGSNNISGNIKCHGKAIRLINGERMRKEEVLELELVLDYRLNQMHLATTYAEFAGLAVVECGLWDTESWTNEQARNKTSADKKISELATLHYNKYHFIRSQIMSKHIFNDPAGHDGDYFGKPNHYLAIAFATSDMSKDEVLHAINMIATLKRTEEIKLANSDIGMKVRHSLRVKDATNLVLQKLGRAVE